MPERLVRCNYNWPALRDRDQKLFIRRNSIFISLTILDSTDLTFAFWIIPKLVGNSANSTKVFDRSFSVREKCEKVGSTNHRDDWINFELPDNHFPDKISYELHDVFRDLLVFSHRHLKLSGRLVFWFPVARDELQGKSLNYQWKRSKRFG